MQTSLAQLPGVVAVLEMMEVFLAVDKEGMFLSRILTQTMSGRAANNVFHIYGHNVGTSIVDAPLGFGIYIFWRCGVIELRVRWFFLAEIIPSEKMCLLEHGYSVNYG
ncbi:hypothetical protein BS47DRAFT_1368208 [Hydnum rufescens UP504]|uniref:Uncharacterized protein n=1 Tax=Hydnum rufescens UP504 TaxID=1448309 RepID=A0A9P6AG46_9AGAM|nr:hypothetical protein BS47DRAFT_1368208 [Hydnum rufescens UP504]